MSYPPYHFVCKDWFTISSFIKTFPLGTIITYFEDEIYTSHIPFIIQNKKLIGHIDKKNPQFLHLDKAKVEVIFHAGSAYISPSEFETDELPTFNYAKVHVKGKAVYVDDSRLIQSLVDMTSEMDDSFKIEKNHPRINKLKHFIQGVEISMDAFHGRFKMSQDKSPAHFEKAKLMLGESQKSKLCEFLNTLKV